MKTKDKSAGYFLLEVLIAIAVLAIAVTSCIKVFGQSFRVQQKMSEITAGKTASETLLFRLVSGDFADILSKKGGWKKGSIPAPDWPSGNLNYEILAEEIQVSKPPAAEPEPAANKSEESPSLPQSGLGLGQSPRMQMPFVASRAIPPYDPFQARRKNQSPGGDSAEAGSVESGAAKLYRVDVKILSSAGKEIYNTRVILQNEK